MNIKTTAGHLTAHDKRVIVAILKAGGTGAKTPKKTFRIEGHDVWVTMAQMEWSGSRDVTRKSSFAYDREELSAPPDAIPEAAKE